MKFKMIFLIVATVIATCCATRSAIAIAISYQVVVSGNTGGDPCSEFLRTTLMAP